jgi:F0F1-type ATP synthase membrane subunit b/b'
MFSRAIILFLFVTSAGFCWAGGGGEIPVRFVFFQILNFSLFAVALMYLIRKKAPGYLKQKEADFLEYRKKAMEQEDRQTGACLSLKKEVQGLVEKEKNIKQTVATALDNLKEELETQEKQWSESLKLQVAREIKLRRLKELNGLRDRFLFQVMQQTRKHLAETKEESVIRLDQMVKGWDKG